MELDNSMICPGSDLSQIPGYGAHSFRDTEKIEGKIEHIDLTVYSVYAIEKCAEILSTVLEETYPKCAFCANRRDCHGFRDCEWSRKTEVTQIRNLCMGISAAIKARGGLHNESE